MIIQQWFMPMLFKRQTLQSNNLLPDMPVQSTHYSWKQYHVLRKRKLSSVWKYWIFKFDPAWTKMKPELTSAMWFPVSHYIRTSDLLPLQIDEHSKYRNVTFHKQYNLGKNSAKLLFRSWETILSPLIHVMEVRAFKTFHLHSYCKSV